MFRQRDRQVLRTSACRSKSSTLLRLVHQHIGTNGRAFRLCTTSYLTQTHGIPVSWGRDSVKREGWRSGEAGSARTNGYDARSCRQHRVPTVGVAASESSCCGYNNEPPIHDGGERGA